VLVEPGPPRERYGLHAVLFLATLLCMVNAGIVLVGRNLVYEAGGWGAMVADGLRYAIPFLGFLTVHEFGHYLAARRHGIAVSLPYYLPIPFALGTFGAVIRIREPMRRTRQLFDVGAAGPLAGFVVALGLLLAGLLTLPPPEYLLGISGHEPVVYAARAFGAFPEEFTAPRGAMLLLFGDTLLYNGITSLFPFVPPAYELQHYPLLLAGWLGLFFTALNLLPVGQLDGGHVVYALFGPRVHRVVARVTTLVLITSGALAAPRDVAPLLSGGLAELGLPPGGGGVLVWALLALLLFAYLRRLFRNDLRVALPALLALMGLVAGANRFAPGVVEAFGYTGWLFWGALLLFLIRVDHPPVLVREPLTPLQKALGYFCLLLFVLCFSIQPITEGIVQ